MMSREESIHISVLRECNGNSTNSLTNFNKNQSEILVRFILWGPSLMVTFYRAPSNRVRFHCRNKLFAKWPTPKNTHRQWKSLNLKVVFMKNYYLSHNGCWSYFTIYISGVARLSSVEGMNQNLLKTCVGLIQQGYNLSTLDSLLYSPMLCSTTAIFTIKHVWKQDFND